MLTLGINTSQAASDLAIIRGDTVLAESLDTVMQGQDERLPALLDQLISQAGVTLSDLNRIAVVTGPGSFTGIRIGVAFARGLALALRIDCVGISSLEAGIDPKDRSRLSAALPAKKRPPDKTWWIQTLNSGIGTDEVTELTESEVGEVVHATPRALWAAQKSASLEASKHPPAPIYARQPDAKPMKPPA
ncbi:MAG: tRNA (adenosine(37)-N6)-threonylcarbamoyltransferase complex dimerization subunit type 1 TsaB [Pseudomonadota bacterium]